MEGGHYKVRGRNDQVIGRNDHECIGKNDQVIGRNRARSRTDKVENWHRVARSGKTEGQGTDAELARRR